MPKQLVVNDAHSRPVQMPVAWVITILTLGYMLPWAVAAARGKSNTGAIGWLNLQQGWTFVGWVIALVMACGSHQVVGVQQPLMVGGHVPPAHVLPPAPTPAVYQNGVPWRYAPDGSVLHPDAAYPQPPAPV